MTNKLWRLLFTVLLTGVSAALGWYAAGIFLDPFFFSRKDLVWVTPLYRGVFTAVGIVFGFAMGRTILVLGEKLRDMATRDKVAIAIGLVIGLVLTTVVSIPILIAVTPKAVGVVLMLLVGVVLTYLSTVATLSMKEELLFYRPPQPPASEEEAIPKGKFKILDTNVIIDGRIADVARAGFVEGTIYIPGFILDELQHIADSSDGLKRARGRRGLDILNAMRNEMQLMVRTYDRLAPGHEEVDSRLVRLAKAMEGAIVTNDFNLNKVAELQGVPVLNLNELANALKPVVLPGEEMQVVLVKEGKEPSQGIGYLDDGTMIVVEGGRPHLGETVEVSVTSVLQTTAGKMIFAHLAQNENGENEYDRGVRAYTRGGPRRPVRR